MYAYACAHAHARTYTRAEKNKTIIILNHFNKIDINYPNRARLWDCTKYVYEVIKKQVNIEK